MNLVLLLISMIEMVVIIILLIMLIKKPKKKFNIEDYEYIIISNCRTVIRDVGIESITIDDLAEEVKNRFYEELESANIKINDPINDIIMRDYIKNIIFINNLLAEVQSEEDNQEDEIKQIDEIITTKNEQYTAVSTIDAINNFYIDL